MAIKFVTIQFHLSDYIRYDCSFDYRSSDIADLVGSPVWMGSNRQIRIGRVVDTFRDIVYARIDSSFQRVIMVPKSVAGM